MVSVGITSDESWDLNEETVTLSSEDGALVENSEISSNVDSTNEESTTVDELTWAEDDVTCSIDDKMSVEVLLE